MEKKKAALTGKKNCYELSTVNSTNAEVTERLFMIMKMIIMMIVMSSNNDFVFFLPHFCIRVYDRYPI